MNFLLAICASCILLSFLSKLPIGWSVETVSPRVAGLLGTCHAGAGAGAA